MESTELKNTKKTIWIILLIIVLGIGGFVAYIFFSGSSNVFLKDQLAVQIDEKLGTGTTPNFLPYQYKLQSYGITSASQHAVTYQTYSAQAVYTLAATEAQIVDALELKSTADLYCKNGTAKIFYGTRTDPSLSGLLFKDGSDWCLANQITTSTISMWINAVMNKHYT